MDITTSRSAWWDRSLNEVGVRSMEKLLPDNASWDDVLDLGRADLKRGFQISGVTPSRNQVVVDIGCGVGRMSQALGEHYGRVIGVDISHRLLQEARERNQASHVQFQELPNGRLAGHVSGPVDVIFSYEVLYLLPREVLLNYFRDAYPLLSPGGLLFFQLNLLPMTWKTHLARQLRRGLALCGISQWRGWPTSNLRRFPYNAGWVSQQLHEIGFQPVQVCGLDDPQQTWFVARKPAAL